MVSFYTSVLFCFEFWFVYLVYMEGFTSSEISGRKAGTAGLDRGTEIGLNTMKYFVKGLDFQYTPVLYLSGEWKFRLFFYA